MRELVHRIRSTGPRIIAGYVEDAQSLGLLWQAEIELVLPIVKADGEYFDDEFRDA